MPERSRTTTQPCPQPILDLIERFELHAETYRLLTYNETQVRREFIDPFFTALGWDLDNEQGHAEAYKDVIHEDAIKVGGSTKAPDYCFRIGGVRKFFVEAKKPSVSVADDPGPAYQLRRYAWTNKLPLSIVTDFEEFAVYDCRIKPKPDDKPSTARVLYLKCDEYPKRWDEIASIFSKDAILKGSFDKYAESNKRKRGTAEVDDEFLKEIESWRDELARSIALRNPNLSVRDLNYAVGKTIDRIIFLRMCEDRGVETYAQLRLLLNGPRVYPRLLDIFYKADQRYNSGLFHFEVEKNRPDPPDTLTPNLTIDDAVLKDILKNLYYPQCPYEFSVMPPEILGQVYEQFLGKVITLTAGHRAKVEYKPEVKKAGGVYYTPKYIVDYIVEHTVGALLEEEGLGSGVWGLRKGTNNADENVSRTGSVAKGDGPCGSDVPADENLPGGRAVRSDEPVAARGRLSPRKHRGRVREGPSQGIPTTPDNSQRVADGTGDAPDHRSAAGVSDSRENAPSVGSDAAGRPDADQAHRRPQVPPKIPTPEPQPLNPTDVAKLRILDPACGSGSFLLGAYQRLLDWHLRWYSEHEPEKWLKKKNPPIYETTGYGVWGMGSKRRSSRSGVSKPQPPNPNPQSPTPAYRLTITEKKRILLNNIFGVDIDPQAVEVTKLSLLLKVLEGESQQTLDNQLRLFHERALPDLGGNIKCGNSLIGPDFYDNQQLTLLDDEERYRINVFDWHAEFPEIMRGGGFEAVIGNPPYGGYFSEEEKTFLNIHYHCQTYQLDSYQLFLERAVTLLAASGGFIGMIIPNPWLTNILQTKLRAMVVRKTRVVEVVHFLFAVFPKVTVDTEVVILQRDPVAQADCNVRIVERIGISEGPRPVFIGRTIKHDQESWRETEGGVINLFLSETEKRLSRKTVERSCTLGSLCAINVGIKPYQQGKGKPPQSKMDVERRVFDSDRKIDGTYRKYLRGADIQRYVITPVEPRFIKYGPWLAEPRPAAKFDVPKKLLMRQTGDRPIAALDTKKHLCLNNLHVIVPKTMFPALEFLLGVLNSSLVQWYYYTLNPEVGEALAEVKRTNVSLLPIPRISEEVKRPRNAHTRMVELVERMLDLHKQLTAAKTPSDQTAIQRQIDATDRQIDQLVYELYGLTEEEIRIVGEATGRQ